MTTSEHLKTELNRSLEQLHNLREELRVKLDQASVDAKREWEKLEPEIEAAINHARINLSDAARKALQESSDALKKLKDSIKT
jgi:hypothetical protein